MDCNCIEMREEGEQVVQLQVIDANVGSDEITPLLSDAEKPKMTIFSVSYPKRKPQESSTKAVDMEITLFKQFVLWTWSGSRFSGILCMALSSTIYFIMEVLLDVFSVRSLPLFEIVFTRCTVILILSFVWLRRTGQPVFGPTHVRNLLIARAITGYLSLLSFIYSIQSQPLSNAIVLNFTTPIMATIVARFVFREKLTLPDIGGLVCSFLGLLFIFRPMLVMKGGLTEIGKPSYMHVVRGSHPVLAILVGLFSSTTGGISYCLVRAGAKASVQPVVTTFAFGIFAAPAAAICAFALHDFILPDLYSFLVMVLLGVLAFFAEIFLARGLQLEKTSKVTNIQYIEAFLSQMWGITFLRVAPSFSRLVGCLLILASSCSTMYVGPEKETDADDHL